MKNEHVFFKTVFPFFLTFFFGAFNDNLFRNALVILIVYQSGFSAEKASQLTFLASALLMFPFFLVSALSGFLADKYSHNPLFRISKILEFVLMVPALLGFASGHVWSLLFLLFLMGTQSAIYSPLKYSYCPKMLPPEDLIKGNACVNAGTYLAVILGAILGNSLITVRNGGFCTGAALLLIAGIGTAGAFMIPKMGPSDANVRIPLNPVKAMTYVLKFVFRDRVLLRCIIGLSMFWMTGALYVSVLAGFCKDILGADTALVSVLYLIFSVGVALGSLLCLRVEKYIGVMSLVSPALFLMAMFTLDLRFAAIVWVKPDTVLFSVREVFQIPTFRRIAVDLLMLSICGGFYSVPLNSLLGYRANNSHLARSLSANNLINSLAITVGSVCISLGLQLHLIGIAGVPAVIAVINLLTALYLLPLRREILPSRFKRSS